ncbi:unnamed protein product [Caenorhabditis bovis]|uniref:Uncharacterized protein n=1 Tax=Caenorhabditis bovis TaxID=2654633 RepID=A0A8S1EAQ7_9PELO|nr:unnamed protein product [Caenorhabditis bovis]
MDDEEDDEIVTVPLSYCHSSLLREHQYPLIRGFYADDQISVNGTNFTTVKHKGPLNETHLDQFKLNRFANGLCIKLGCVAYESDKTDDHVSNYVTTHFHFFDKIQYYLKHYGNVINRAQGVYSDTALNFFIRVITNTRRLNLRNSVERFLYSDLSAEAEAANLRWNIGERKVTLENTGVVNILVFVFDRFLFAGLEILKFLDFHPYYLETRLVDCTTVPLVLYARISSTMIVVDLEPLCGEFLLEVAATRQCKCYGIMSSRLEKQAALENQKEFMKNCGSFPAVDFLVGPIEQEHILAQADRVLIRIISDHHSDPDLLDQRFKRFFNVLAICKPGTIALIIIENHFKLDQSYVKAKMEYENLEQLERIEVTELRYRWLIYRILCK